MSCVFCPPDHKLTWFETASWWVAWSLYPVSPGHTLLIPKRHVASWFDLYDFEQRDIGRLLHKARSVVDHEYATPDGYNVGINDGEAAGQTVMHAHVHLIPRFKGDVPDPRGGVRHVIPHLANYRANPQLWTPDGWKIETAKITYEGIPTTLECLRRGGVVTTTKLGALPLGTRVVVVNGDDETRSDRVVATVVHDDHASKLTHGVALQVVP